jgi:hypothetical protein
MEKKKNELIVVEPRSVEKSNKGLITGVIYFNFDQYKFPEIGWNDYIVIILGWWLDSIERLSKGLTKTVDLKFMDGPLRVRLSTNEKKIALSNV